MPIDSVLRSPLSFLTPHVFLFFFLDHYSYRFIDFINHLKKSLGFLVFLYFYNSLISILILIISLLVSTFGLICSSFFSSFLMCKLRSLV